MCELESVDGISIPKLSERPILHLLMDEETRNFRSGNLMCGPLHIRGFSTKSGVPSNVERYEPCYCVCCTLNGSILKGTLLLNYFRGPFKSSQYAYNLQEVAKKYLRDTGGSELLSLSEAWSTDMGFDSTVILTGGPFMDQPGICNRLPIVSKLC